MTTETLTPAELEMIKVKREQDALALKKAEAEKALHLEKAINGKKSWIETWTKADTSQIKAAKDYLAEFASNQYTLEIDAKTDEAKVMDNDEVVWSEKYLRQTAVIKRGAYKIRVTEYRTYSSKWDSKGTFKGYRMYVSGPKIDFKQESRAYARVSTVNQIIDDAIKQIEREQYMEQCKKDAVRTTVEQMQAKYPKAIVEVGYEFTKSYGPRYQTPTKFDTVKVTLENGVSVKYRVYPDGQLGRLDIVFPKHDAWDLLDTLNQMNF